MAISVRTLTYSVDDRSLERFPIGQSVFRVRAVEIIFRGTFLPVECTHLRSSLVRRTGGLFHNAVFYRTLRSLGLYQVCPANSSR